MMDVASRSVISRRLGILPHVCVCSVNRTYQLDPAIEIAYSEWAVSQGGHPLSPRVAESVCRDDSVIEPLK